MKFIKRAIVLSTIGVVAYKAWEAFGKVEQTATDTVYSITIPKRNV